jgi:hypothetical protein
MPTWISNLVTGRATLLALIVTAIALLGAFGFAVPSGTGDALTKFVDALLVFVATVLTGSHLHNSNSPSESKKSPLSNGIVFLVLAISSAIGCSSLGHAKNPIVQAAACGLSQLALDTLGTMVQAFGVPLNVLEEIYADWCGVAGRAGLTGDAAEKFALDHVHTAAASMHKAGARFEQTK